MGPGAREPCSPPPYSEDFPPGLSHRSQETEQACDKLPHLSEAAGLVPVVKAAQCHEDGLKIVT